LKILLKSFSCHPLSQDSLLAEIKKPEDIYKETLAFLEAFSLVFFLKYFPAERG